MGSFLPSIFCQGQRLQKKKSDAFAIFIWILIYVLYKLLRTVLQLQRTVISPDNSVDLSCHRVYRDTELSIFYTGSLGRFESILPILNNLNIL